MVTGGIRNRSISDDAQIDIHKVIGAGRPMHRSRYAYYVDGDSGADRDSGRSPIHAFKTVQRAIDVASNWDVIYVFPKAMSTGATDPASYEENLIIPATHDGLSIIGIGTGRCQGGLPQFKDGTGTTTEILIIRAPGCLIANIGFNGAGNTGGCILFDDDASTKTAFGTTIKNCHFKNAKSSGNASTGGAIQWSSAGGAWQILIEDCRFYNCRGGIVLRGTTSSRPQDVVIQNCDFGSSANTTIDCDIYLAGGSGVDGVTIRHCDFSTVDVPAYASSPAAARYVDLTGCEGAMIDCNFACISQGTSAKTFTAAGDGVKVPAEVRMSGCHGEPASDATGDAGDIFRT